VLLEGAEALATGYPDSAWPAARTMLLSESGDVDRARQSFEVYARSGFKQLRRDANWMTAVACLSMTCSTLQDAAAAEVLYDLLSPYADLTTSVLTGSASLGSNHFFCGLTAEAAGRLDTAIDHFGTALDVHLANGQQFLVPRLRYVLARALLARGGDGDRDRATEQVERGLDEARALGALPEVEHLLSVRLGHAGLADLDPNMSIALVATSVERNRPDLGRATAPDGTVTIMFSDIEGSTALTDKLGDRRWMELLGVHNRIVREAVTAHGGYEVKSQGDGFMIAFASASRAVHCACAIQRALAAHRATGADEPLHVRIGLHTGEVLREEEDFFGRNVILAARIAAKANGDEILVSGLLRELIASSGDFQFGDEQELELKGLSGVQRVAEVRWS
jgi:class 3 adenylate cyclase